MFERPCSAMDYSDLGAGPGGYVGKLERNISAADKRDLGRQFVKIQKIFAGKNVLLTRDIERGRRRAGRDEDFLAKQCFLAYRYRLTVDKRCAAPKYFHSGFGKLFFETRRKRLRKGALET